MSVIDENKLVKEAYKPIAQSFNKTRRNPWAWQQQFLNRIGNGFYYDIGCGGGRLLNKYNSIGVDSCPEFVNIVKDKGFNVVLNDMTDLPFRDNSADAIICIASFHHLSTLKRRYNALLEMKRVLKPDGIILISVWSKNQPKDTEEKKKFPKYGDVIVPWMDKYKNVVCERYYYIFQLDEIEKIFKDVGFQIISHKWDYGNEIYELRN